MGFYGKMISMQKLCYDKLMSNPFIKNFEHLFSSIRVDIKEKGQISGCYIADESGIFDNLLVQPLIRSIFSKEIKFTGVRNIVLKEQHKSKGLFTEFVNSLEALDIPIIYHDVVNSRLVPYFNKRDYKTYKDYKYEQQITSFYRI